SSPGRATSPTSWRSTRSWPRWWPTRASPTPCARATPPPCAPWAPRSPRATGTRPALRPPRCSSPTPAPSVDGLATDWYNQCRTGWTSSGQKAAPVDKLIIGAIPFFLLSVALEALALRHAAHEQDERAPVGYEARD